MNDRALAALFVLAIWWLSTGIVLKTVWLPRSTFRTSVAIFSVLGALGLYGIYASSTIASPHSAYAGFASALLVWAWHELTFLLGMITGPRKLACPPEARGWLRFRHATAAIIHHEVALALTLGVIAAMTWGNPNQVGTSTFLILWVMRLSAKLNVFLGVRNISAQFVPTHLRHLLSYFRNARMNVLMPFSIALGGITTAWLARVSFASESDSFTAVGHMLLATVLALAVIEHVFLALPLPDAVLWRWIISTKEKRQASLTLQCVTKKANEWPN